MKKMTGKGNDKYELPRELVQAIIRVQAERNLDWEDACKALALVADPQREEYKKAVRKEALALGRSEMMTSLNKARDTIYSQAYNNGVQSTREHETNFSTPCAGCGVPMRFSSRDTDWPQVHAILNKAFADWRHVGH